VQGKTKVIFYFFKLGQFLLEFRQHI